MASKKGVFESAGSSPVVSEMSQPTDSQRYKDSISEFTEFVKEAMNNHTVAMINQIAIFEWKLKDLLEDTKANTEHNDNAGDILIKAEKVESAGSQELSSLLPALCDDLERKVENDQPCEVLEEEGDLPAAFTQLTEKKQLNFSLRTDDNLWFYRTRNELIDYISKKRRYGGSKSEEILLKRGQFLQIHQPQIKIKNPLKTEVGGMKKDWKKCKKKARMED